MKTQTNYEKQAQDFLDETKTTLETSFLKHGKHFEDDKDSRDIYKVILKRGSRSYSFNFGQSIYHSGKYIILVNKYPQYTKDQRLHENEIKKAKIDFIGSGYNRFYKVNENFSEPNAYDVLTCLQKYEVGTFEEFCSDFGYDTDSIKAEKVYKAVVNEFSNLKQLFSDEELEKMLEIQ